MLENLPLSPPWIWLTAGLVLMIAELIAPGFYLIWIGAAAMLTGLIAFSGIGDAAQFACFAVLTVVSVIIARRWFKAYPIESTDPLLNNRAAQMIGEIVTVVEPIIGGDGRVRVGDSEWIAHGADAAIGTRLRVTGVNTRGGVLVEPV